MNSFYLTINWDRWWSICQSTIPSTLLKKVPSDTNYFFGSWTDVRHVGSTSLSIVSQGSFGHLRPGITNNIIPHWIHLWLSGDPSYSNEISLGNHQEAVGHQFASRSVIIKSSWSLTKRSLHLFWQRMLWETSPQLINKFQAYKDVVMQLDWKTFTILYDDEDSLIRLQDLMKMSATYGYKVYVRRLPSSGNYR